MEIKKAEIRYWKLDGGMSTTNEGLKHVKVLPYLSIVQAVEGSYDIALGSDPMEQTGEMGFFIAPAHVQQTIVHHVNSNSGRMRCRWIFLDVEINRAYPLDALYRFPTVVGDEKKYELHALFEELFASKNLLDTYGACYKLLGKLLEMATPLQRKEASGVQAAVAYLTEHYRESITVEELAGLANMSQSNFHAAFKKQVGSSPIAFLNRYRMSLAAQRLCETDEAVCEIGYGVGVMDPLYFSKLFKQTFGTSPRDYREMHTRSAIKT